MRVQGQEDKLKWHEKDILKHIEPNKVLYIGHSQTIIIIFACFIILYQFVHSGTDYYIFLIKPLFIPFLFSVPQHHSPGNHERYIRK